ncbi:hypothetical protein CVM73_03445 [Bradyrhizobium forestalis]|uniref:DUF4760 domain-containing protein n=1 Tax=Bradyrhizobium forestalis TaxID=1419263 RepID=A0A2M8RFL6_9BRAD|nr:DUF4760 domain-containing protein [Bradyrhizobium forestalis]PJG56617.1 hypothetical protein CVM73_03445 [Bradyrhizobium forestalis]
MGGQAIALWGWAAYDAVHFAARKLLPYAPLITPLVGIIAGCIAFYSIHVTRSIARRRATIDFFLKTEVDSSIVKLFQSFDDHVEAVSKEIRGGKTLKEIVKSPEYKTVHACLNIHELIAVGIHNKVFDEKVAYNYWSGALVGHCKDAAEIIDFSRSDPDDLSAYIAMLDLNKRWKKKLDGWALRQRKKQPPAIVVPGPITPAAPAGGQQTPVDTPSGQIK